MTIAHASAEVTLRQRIDELTARGAPLDVAQAIGILVPLAALLADQHRQGYTFFVYPSALLEDPAGNYYASQLSAQPPTDPRDLACLPPEAAGQQPGTARASVYAVAAILYELITLRSVGPNMVRPSEIIPGVPPALEAVLSKALVADPAHRPDDLNALAQALYDIAPKHSVAPPPGDVSHLDHDGGFDVDISLSMMPPAPAAAPVAASPYDMPVQTAAPVSSPRPVGSNNQTEELAQLKARLESDPRPRYVVIREGMDHGPFNAIELLQQLASGTFDGGDTIRDTVEGTEVQVSESPNFAPFAHHARLHREHKEEKAAIARVVAQESRSTKGKAFVGAAAVVGILGVAGVWFLTQRGAKSDEVVVHEDQIANIEADADLEVKKKKFGGSKGGVVGKSGKFPLLGGGMSCQAAQNAYIEEMKMGGSGQADLSAGQFNSVLGNGSYLNSCGVPSSMSVNICAAIQNGRAVGVTVVTTPRSPKHQACLSSAVRRMSFPSHPKLDVTRTTFAAQ